MADLMYNRVNDYGSVTISLASPEEIGRASCRERV